MRNLCSIIAGVICIIIVADMAVREYHARRAQLDYLCQYRVVSRCPCAVRDEACLAQCDAPTRNAIAECAEELKSSYFKLEDQFTWALLLGFPAAYGLGAGTVWAIRCLRATLRFTAR